MTTESPILVINPNSSPAITAQVAVAVERAAALGLRATTVRSPAGPEAIESDEDVERSIAPMLEVAAAHPAEAYVVACFSDPGIEELRAVTGRPVFGIAESAVLTAMARGRRVGIVSSVAASVPRHERYWDQLGVGERIVADLPVGRGVLDLEREDAAADVLATATSLVTEHGTDVIVLGCAGLTHLQARLRGKLQVPIVEPCRAAVTVAATTLADERNDPNCLAGVEW